MSVAPVSGQTPAAIPSQSAPPPHPRSPELGAHLTNVVRVLREQEARERAKRAEELARLGPLQRFD